MRFSVLIILLGVFMAVAQSGQPPKESKHATRELTGLVDERPGAIYILRHEGDMNTIAVLKPVGFENESFAKYLGHRVKIRGEFVQTEGEPVFRVHSIQKID